jgi:hypothetical protein
MCVQALIVLAGVAADQLAAYSPHLAQQLIQEGAEGRLWEGKEGLLSALGSLGAACTRALCVVPGERGTEWNAGVGLGGGG